MGPISNIGPKTLRAARDRPELNPKIVHGARPRTAATSAALTCAIVRHRTAHIGRPATSLLARPSADAQHPAAHSRSATITPIARPAHDRRRDIVRPVAEIQARHGAQHRPTTAQRLALDKASAQVARTHAHERGAPSHTAAAGGRIKNLIFRSKNFKIRYNKTVIVLIRSETWL
ncbi:serine/arginine repetitive matrix protein 1-like [Dorcoceras hygrometricum]|uniref:Serine/arginine repetitive matrix protein 1-like n=1 Tax=Dorcoceras hygrometricum TaxID=472368 RepID=A0A2Z7B5L5_9LAMI|nr:serine/arginine repetitive matrix protein 1-like [Dorcoceras hygrometricum]